MGSIADMVNKVIDYNYFEGEPQTPRFGEITVPDIMSMRIYNLLERMANESETRRFTAFQSAFHRIMYYLQDRGYDIEAISDFCDEYKRICKLEVKNESGHCNSQRRCKQIKV